MYVCFIRLIYFSWRMCKIRCYTFAVCHRSQSKHIFLRILYMSLVGSAHKTELYIFLIIRKVKVFFIRRNIYIDIFLYVWLDFVFFCSHVTLRLKSFKNTYYRTCAIRFVVYAPFFRFSVKDAYLFVFSSLST